VTCNGTRIYQNGSRGLCPSLKLALLQVKQTGTLPKVVVKVSASANKLTTNTDECEGEQMLYEYSITSPKYLQVDFI
jgi:hypothetical protein